MSLINNTRKNSDLLTQNKNKLEITFHLLTTLFCNTLKNKLKFVNATINLN